MEDYFSKVRDFFSEKYKIDRKTLTPETSLFDDLGFYGDDIDDILADFTKHFKLDINKIDLTVYNIGNEPFDFITPIVNHLRNQKRERKKKLLLNDFMLFLIEHKDEKI